MTEKLVHIFRDDFKTSGRTLCGRRTINAYRNNWARATCQKCQREAILRPYSVPYYRALSSDEVEQAFLDAGTRQVKSASLPVAG